MANNCYQFFYENLDTIYENINKVFNLDKSQIKKIMLKIIARGNTKDTFYDIPYHTANLKQSLSEDYLNDLKVFLKSAKLDDETIENIIMYNPEILLYSNQIHNIYPLFKGNDYKGYVLINKDDYRAFDYYNNYNIYYDQNPFNDDLAENNDEYTYSECYGIVREMLNLLSRRDIMDYYKLQPDASLKQKFNALSSRYNKRSYYFFRQSNPIVESLAKNVTKTEDGYYHCDMCNEAIANKMTMRTVHLTPLDEGGKDEIFNIACLCPTCYRKMVKNGRIKEEYTHDVEYKLIMKFYKMKKNFYEERINERLNIESAFDFHTKNTNNNSKGK